MNKRHPFAFPDNSGGFTDGNGNKVVAGDRIQYRVGDRRGVLDEALQDGEAFVTFDDGEHATVNWHHLCKEQAAEPRKAAITRCVITTRSGDDANVLAGRLDGYRIMPIEDFQKLEDCAYERAAKVADAHKGAAAKKRQAKGMLGRNMDDGLYVEVFAEERGENIAAEIIAAAIRALAKESALKSVEKEPLYDESGFSSGVSVEE